MGIEYISRTNYDRNFSTPGNFIRDLDSNHINLTIGIRATAPTVTNMSHVFENCYNLTSISFTEMATYSIEDTSYMFANCNNLQQVQDLDISNVSNSVNMFLNCYNITEFKNLNTSKIKYFDGMFSGCNTFSELEILDTTNAKSLSNMFAGCTNLSKTAYTNITNSLPLAENINNAYLENIGLSVDNFTVPQIQILNLKGYIDAIPNASQFYNIYYENKEVE